MKINSVLTDEQEYISFLTSVNNPPKKLYYIGTLPTKRQPTVAIVGTRKPTAYGKEVAHQLAYDLAKRGVIIVSGLALGIDAIAHKACLEASGTTLAVLGNGLHRIYPHTNRRLGEAIVDNGGAIISEFEAGLEPLPFNFLKRNRIISGLADAVIVVEAASRSGTLNTASHALDQGKDIFAVPGNITSPLSAGCNALLRQGAAPVTCAEDVLEVMQFNGVMGSLAGFGDFNSKQSQTGGSSASAGQASLPLGDTPLESRIIELISQGVRDGDELQKQTNADISDFNASLTMLEINGIITSLGANQWRL